MSDDVFDDPPTVAARLGRSLADATDGIEPAPDGWERIAGRLGERADDRFELPAGPAAARPRIFLVAAAALVVVVLGAVLATRKGDLAVDTVATGSTVVATPTSDARANGSAFAYGTPPPAPAPPPSPPSAPARSIVAITEDGRLVELDHDGVEVRQIYGPAPAPAGSASPSSWIRGPIAVSPVDRTIYVERSVRSSCDLAYVPSWDVVGEIVAIPFAGGEPRVVVEAGGRPAISPDGSRLAYLGPRDGKHCDGSHNEWLVHVKDVSPGSAGRDPLTLDPTASVGGIAPIQPAWTDQHGALVLMARRPDAENLAGRCPTCGPTTYLWIDRLDERGADVSAFGNDVRAEGAMAGPPDRTDDEREAFDVATAPASSTGSPQATVFAGGVRGGGRIALAATTIEVPNPRTAGDRSVVDIDPSVFGDGSYVAVAIDASADGSQILVLATSAPTVPDGGRTRSAIVVEGTSMRLLGRGFLAIGWVP